MAKHARGARCSVLCLAVLVYQLCTLVQRDFAGVPGNRASPVVRRAQPDAKVLAKEVQPAQPSAEEELQLLNQTQGALEKELQKELASAPAPKSEQAEESKPSRAAQKTAETKERVAEKKLRLEREAQKAQDVSEDEFELDFDFAGYAKQAREMAAEAGKEAAKPGKESAAARAKQLALEFVASGLDAASEAPVLVPVGVATLGVVLLALTSGRPAETPVSARPKPAAPVLVTAPSRATVSERLEASPPVPAATPTPAAPAAPAAPKVVPKVPTRQDLPWAKDFAKSARDTLKTVADELPAAEEVVEKAREACIGVKCEDLLGMLGA